MTDFQTLFAYAARPASVLTERGTAPAIQLILESQEAITVVMSGQGMERLAKDILQFLAENPALAATQSLKPQ